MGIMEGKHIAVDFGHRGGAAFQFIGAVVSPTAFGVAPRFQHNADAVIALCRSEFFGNNVPARGIAGRAEVVAYLQVMLLHNHSAAVYLVGLVAAGRGGGDESELP